MSINNTPVFVSEVVINKKVPNDQTGWPVLLEIQGEKI